MLARLITCCSTAQSPVGTCDTQASTRQCMTKKTILTVRRARLCSPPRLVRHPLGWCGTADPIRAYGHGGSDLHAWSANTRLATNVLSLGCAASRHLAATASLAATLPLGERLISLGLGLQTQRAAVLAVLV